MKARRYLSLLIALVGLVASLSLPARADVIYGGGNYSSCGAQTACAPTVTTAPSQFRYSVNLQEDQAIPTGAYNLVITPLNDSATDTHITRAELLVDNVLIATIEPDTDGVLHYRWQTPELGRHTVVVNVYTTKDDQAITQTFHIAITAAGSTASPTPSVPASSNPEDTAPNSPQNPIEAIAQAAQSIAQAAQAVTDAVAQTVTKIIQELPKPLVVSFPYLLLAALFGGLLFAFLQARKEIVHVLALAALAKRQQALAADKDTFIELLSHYLRTPLTIVQGTLDNGVVLHEIDPAVAARLKQPFGSLRTDIEALITQVGNVVAQPQPAALTKPAKRAWLKPGFFVPLVLIALTLLSLNAVTVASGVLPQNLINNLTQAVLVGLIGLLWYILVRSRTIRRREQAQHLAQQAEQKRIDDLKNQLIHQAGTLLATKGANLRQAIASLGQNTQTVRQLLDACDRFDKLTRVFNLAAQLETGRAIEAPVPTALAPLIQESIQNLGSSITHNPVDIDASVNVTLPLRHPNWLKYVCISLFDNAIAYSKAGSHIQVSLQTDQTASRLTITDAGQGIPPEYLERVFTPFAKAEGALNYDHMGLGFSLFLDRLIMQYLGGDISVRSQPGRGTSVTLTLPSSSLTS